MTREKNVDIIARTLCDPSKARRIGWIADETGIGMHSVMRALHNDERFVELKACWWSLAEGAQSHG